MIGLRCAVWAAFAIGVIATFVLGEQTSAGAEQVFQSLFDSGAALAAHYWLERACS